LADRAVPSAPGAGGDDIDESRIAGDGLSRKGCVVVPRRWTRLTGFALAALPLPARAAGVDGAKALALPAVISGLAIVGAAFAHWGLRRVGRRLPRLLGRRAGQPLSTGAPPPWEGAIQLAVLLAQLALWLAVAVFTSEQVSGLRRARQMFAQLVYMSLTSHMFALNGHGYSALDLIELPAVLVAAWIGIGGLTRVLKAHILGATHMERGVQEAVALLMRYTLLFLSAIVILQIWGIDASSLTFVASVLGVGIGFGLQHIANNFVSGLVVSLERPIQPGDFVKVGDWMGTVERVGPRNTEIRTNDNVSILVPNSRFLETEVVNWTHGDPVCRLHVPVGVAYGSDTGRVRAALLEAARGHRDVLTDPRPRVEFRGFGDSALDFELQVWTRNPRNQFRLTSDLNFRIEANLRSYQVVVPFPQRDLHLRSPQLERLLAAFTLQHFGQAETAVARDATPDVAEPSRQAADTFDGELDRRTWSDDELRSLVNRLRGPEGVPVVDRRHLLTVYRQCFVGREAVDWMTRALGLTRSEAVAVGQLLVDRGIVRHVLDEHGFRDAKLFYRFCETDQLQAGASAALSA
jgi:potassium efflux system protein